MKVRSIEVIRHAKSVRPFSARYLPRERRILHGPGCPRIGMLHELGHALEPGGNVPFEAYVIALEMGDFSGPAGLRVIQAEAAAWRWAVRAWTRRGRKLDEAQRSIIRGYFSSYTMQRRIALDYQREVQGKLNQLLADMEEMAAVLGAGRD